MKFKLIIKIGIIVLILTIAIGIFAYRNMNYDYLNEKFLEKKGYKLGFTEMLQIRR